MSAELTSHHRLHAAAYVLLVEAVDGRWDSIRELARRAEEAVAANGATPCVLHAFSLGVCATAHAHVADLEEARRLEQSADAAALGSNVATIAEISLALARGDLAAVAESGPPAPCSRRQAARARRQISRYVSTRWPPSGTRQRVEAEYSSLLRPGTYVEPFALRALGVVWEEAELLDQALARFEAMESHLHARQTRALLGARH